jgi:poly(hydroxyalkanoate) granule-associated protein
MPTKVKTETVKDETKSAEETTSLFEPLRKIVLASIGAIALAQDEMEDFIQKLVDRGEIAEQEAKKLMNEVLKKRKKGAEKTETDIQKGLVNVLDKMNVPTKTDIETLTKKVNELSKKIDQLNKQTEDESVPKPE